MSFLQPWAFLLLGLAVPLLLLYFLKVRRQQRRVSSVLLWSPVFRDRRPRRSSSGCSATRC